MLQFSHFLLMIVNSAPRQVCFACTVHCVCWCCTTFSLQGSEKWQSHLNIKWLLFLSFFFFFAFFSSLNIFIFCFLSFCWISIWLLYFIRRKEMNLFAGSTQIIKVKRGSRNLPGTYHIILRKLRLRNHSLKSQLLTKESALGSQVT